MIQLKMTTLNKEKDILIKEYEQYKCALIERQKKICKLKWKKKIQRLLIKTK
jgi:hypothetical protein